MSADDPGDAPSPRLRALLERIGAGGWVFDALGPAFVEGLCAGRPRPAAPLPALALFRYGALEPVPPWLEAPPAHPAQRETDPARVALWDRLALRVRADARFRSPSPAEVRASDEARALLADVAPETAALIELWLPRWVFVRGDFGSASLPATFGCVFVGDRSPTTDPAGMAVTLVHELAHHELFLLNLIDRLVREGADDGLRFAPLQGRARPPLGRLHAGHALYRMVGFLDAAGLDATADRRLLGETAQTLADETTPFGATLVRLHRDRAAPAVRLS